jgi:YidC/Oxa1 family membrane protein insertase
MDLQRLFLFLIFTFSLVLVWDGWQRYQHPDQYVQKELATGTELSKSQGNLSTTNGVASVPELSQLSGKTISVKTDMYEAEISTIGGDISRLALLKHPDSEDKTKPFLLFARGEGTHNEVAQSGLLGVGLPNHNALFQAGQDHYNLLGNEQKLQVRLTYLSDSKLKVSKILTFHRGSYLIDVAYELNNTGPLAVTASSYFQIIRDSVPPVGSTKFLSTFTGPAVYT